MPFTPGMERPPGAGRKPGNGNKAKVAKILADLNCDPIEGMARIALDEKNSPQIRGKMYAELAQYLWPKLRAIEHTGADGGPIELDANVPARERLTDLVSRTAERVKP